MVPGLLVAEAFVACLRYIAVGCPANNTRTVPFSFPATPEGKHRGVVWEETIILLPDAVQYGRDPRGMMKMA